MIFYSSFYLGIIVILRSLSTQPICPEGPPRPSPASLQGQRSVKINRTSSCLCGLPPSLPLGRSAVTLNLLKARSLTTTELCQSDSWDLGDFISFLAKRPSFHRCPSHIHHNRTCPHTHALCLCVKQNWLVNHFFIQIIMEVYA